MDKEKLIELLQSIDGDEVKIEGRVSDMYSSIGEVELLEDGTIVLRPE